MRKVLAAIGALAIGAGTYACASLLGIESVDYAAVDGGADAGEASATETGVLPEAGEACTGAICGARCCRKGAVCMDAGACSNDVVHVSGGGNGSCALVADGTVYCWGENGLGQVGVGDAGDDQCTFILNGGQSIKVPCRVTPTKVLGLPPASSVASGFQLACAIEAADGGVWCWGKNTEGALGRPDTDDPLCPDFLRIDPDGGVPLVHCNPTPRKVPGITGAVEVVASDSDVCARTSTGKVFCWGAGTDGTLGDDAGASSALPVMVQGLPADIVQLSIALYGQGACAVAADGSAWCWGDRVALEPKTYTAHAATGGGASPLANIAEINVTLPSVCVRKKDGVLSCWGDNANADLGRGVCETASHPVGTVVGVPAATSVAGGFLHRCALFADGTVSCWGVAQDGAMGQGTIMGDGKCSDLNSQGTPRVVSLPRITKIAAGIETSFAIDEDGRLWAWGAADFGRLGRAPNGPGDLTNCGDTNNQTVCHATPILVDKLP